MSAKDLASDFVGLLKSGKFEDASAKFHADDIVSIEAMGPPGMDLAARGKAAVEAKSEWWYTNHEIHNVEVEGPYINGDQFGVKFTLNVTVKATGEKLHMTEFGLYTVKNGKVAEERFFYAA